MTKPLTIASIVVAILIASFGLAWIIQVASNNQAEHEHQDIARLSGDAFDQQYIRDMLVHHQGAIDMAQLAISKSQNHNIIVLSNTIISDQTAQNDQMKQWQIDWGYPIEESVDQSSTMAHDMHSMTTSLDSLNGSQFDAEFLKQMIAHHQVAIDMSELAATNAKHQQLKDLALQVIQDQNQEIDQMKQWQAELVPQDE